MSFILPQSKLWCNHIMRKCVYWLELFLRWAMWPMRIFCNFLNFFFIIPKGLVQFPPTTFCHLSNSKFIFLHIWMLLLFRYPLSDQIYVLCTYRKKMIQHKTPYMFIFFVVVHHKSCVDMVKIGFPSLRRNNYHKMYPD